LVHLEPIAVGSPLRDGGFAVVRWVYRAAFHVNRELDEARLAKTTEAAASREIRTLRQDPVTGSYRPG